MGEHVVVTGIPPGQGIPRHYKLDIANSTERIAIELDGHSHYPKKVAAADQRKVAFLAERGWCVLRISNEVAMRWYTTFTSEITLRTTLAAYLSITAT